MAKSYDNISFKAGSSSDHHYFENTYSFTSIFRRIITGSMGTTIRGMVRDIAIVEGGGANADQYSFPIEAGDISYLRITNLSSTVGLIFSMYNSESDKVLYFEIQPEESFQFHSQLKWDDNTVVYPMDWLAIRSKTGSDARMDLFIGFEA